MTAWSWMRLGAIYSSRYEFTGTFYGNGHTIRLYWDGQTSENYQGLFYKIGEGGTVQDLKVEGNVTCKGSRLVGGIAGENDGTITSGRSYVAALVGTTIGTGNIIQNCVVSANVNGHLNVGGIVGLHYSKSNISISGCVYSGKITGGSQTTGVFIGSGYGSDPGTVTDCLYIMADGQSTTNFDLVKDGGVTISNCYKTTSAGSQGTKAYTYATAPDYLGTSGTDYGMVKAYANGIFYGSKYYIVPGSISLTDDADNSSTISTNIGYSLDVTLADRTFYKDDAWNTICLPFDVTLAGSQLEGAVARPLTEASISGSTLNLTFGDAVTTLVAGTPYIIKWPSAISTFKNTAISGTEGVQYYSEGYASLVDGNTNTKWCSKASAPWECVFTTSTPINVKGYTLTTGDDTGSFPDRNPKKWTLEAKATSGGNWTTIDSRDVSANSGDALPAANTAESKVYAVASDKQGTYQFFRFKVSQSGGSIMQLAELKLQGIIADLVSPVFNGVIIDDTDRSYDNGAIGDQRVRFIGTYKSTAFDAIDKSILLMGGENMLYTPAAGASIGALRAYFKIGDGTANARRITRFNINFGEGETTSLNEELRMKNEESADAWYSLDGRKFDGKPSRAGVYIYKGVKRVIK